MNPTYHLSAEVAVTLIVVVYFQLKMSSIRSDLDEHIKKYEADKQEIGQALNNLYEQLNLVQQQLRHSITAPQDQQYAIPPQARLPPPSQNPAAPGPQAYQAGPGRAQQPRPMSPPPRGSREEFMGRQHPGVPPAGMAMHQPPPPPPQAGGRQLPGMPQAQQQPPPMKYDVDDGGGPGAYGTIDDEEEQNFYASGKKGSLKAMAASIEQSRRQSIPVDMPRNQDM